MEKDHNSALLSQIAASPTAFHAVDTARRRLEEDGYTALDPSARWQLVPGGKYYLTANGSTLLAFRLPQGQPTGFLIAAAHSDAPCFKIKPGCEGAAAGHYVRLNTERYGGTLLNTWFDRPWPSPAACWWRRMAAWSATWSAPWKTPPSSPA